MKVIKPNRLSVLTRCFEHRREFHLGASVLAFISLTKNAPLLSEVSMWTFVAERLGKDAALDVGIPKTAAEFLIHGSAYAPGACARDCVAVRAIVGRNEKSLLVHGDRYWRSERTPSTPLPFTTMPLDWTRAYGGPDYARNPLGRGHGEQELAGQRVQLLPNIEYPGQLVESATSEAEPASFGPIDISWPQRVELAGTYDAAWLEQLFPGLARDVDWSLFNLAAGDQRQSGAWSGGDVYQFDNMHPEQPRLAGTLPHYRARAFVTRELGGARPPGPGTGDEPVTRFDEIGLQLSTLWFFPDAERAVLIFQGSTPIRTDDAADIRHLVVAAERPDAPRPSTHYEGVLASRLDPKTGVLAALREHDLLPSDLPKTDEHMAAALELYATEGLLQKNMYNRAVAEHEAAVARIVDLGLDPAEYAPPPPQPPSDPPELDELPAIIEQAEADAEAHRVEAEAKKKEAREQAKRQFEAAGMDPEKELAGLDTPPTGPPTFTAEGQRAALMAPVLEARAAGTPIESLEQMLADPEVRESWENAERQLRASYRLSAHMQEPAPALDPKPSAEARARVIAALEQGEDFSTLNLTGADLSGMDLRSADLSGAFFESVKLDGADLREAKLNDAVLAHASLLGAKLDGADLRKANFGKSRLCGASIVGAALEGAILTGADLSEASLARSNIVDVDLREAVLRGANLSEVEAGSLTLLEGTQIAGMRLSGARVSKGVFLNLDMSGVDLSGAVLHKCSFIGCKAPGVSFAGATLDNSCFVQSCDLDGAVFTEASMEVCNLRGSSMRGCELSKATLDGADLSDCQLAGSRFYQAVARGARFTKADLSGAVMLCANLMGASFMGATLVDADLRASNLHGADMARVRTDGRLHLDEALLTKVRVNPSYTEVLDDPA